DNGLATIEFYQDGRLEESRELSGRRVSQTIVLSRRPHVRRITAVATGAHGFKSRPVTLDVPPRHGASNTLYAVAVGVDTYDHLQPLNGAKVDAETVVAAVKSLAGSYYRNVRTMIRVDRAAAPAAVLTDLRAAVAAATADDTI